ncbi:MAG: DUF177 domain-containing protein [Erysipelotrichaceae bacterium]|nr:DUF177 domain-containing protein [Erysipelotrichaceae bacterium]MDY6035261.1 YceD family protein [Bulleidia sp.]
MKWTKTELLRDIQNVSFNEDVEIDPSAYQNDSGIISTKNVHVEGRGYIDDEDDRFYVDMHITGVMICPDAITNEAIEVPLDVESEETYVFEETDEDGVRLVTSEVVDLLPAVIDAILLEVPLQVTEAEEGNYPSGDGWQILTEAEYQERQKDRIDPRLAELKQFKDE